MAFWRNRGELQALRGMCLAIGSAASVLVTVVLASIGVSAVLCSVCLTCCGAVFLPASIYIADRISKKQIANMQPPNLGDRQRLVRLQYDDECIMIDNMTLDEKTKKQLRLNAFNSYLKKREEIDAVIVGNTISILPAKNVILQQGRISDRRKDDVLDVEEVE